MRDPPHQWFYCGVSLGHAQIVIQGDTAIRRKLSQGVSALRPGAELVARVAPFRSRVARLHVEYLASYEGMGMVEVACAEGCSCEPQTIDAHTTAQDVRNVSVFQSHEFEAFRATPRGSTRRGRRPRSTPCELKVTLLARTSSGAHKFKLCSLTVKGALPNVTRR